MLRSFSPARAADLPVSAFSPSYIARPKCSDRKVVVLARAVQSEVQGKVAVIGGGPGGLVSAILLADLHLDVKVFEKLPAPVKGTALGNARTIVFNINARGQQALKQAGVRLPPAQSSGEHPDESDMPLRMAGKVHRNFCDAPGTVNRLPPTFLPGNMFVQRAALVEHLYFETKRLQPDRVTLANSTEVTAMDLSSKVRAALQQLDPSMKVDVVPGWRWFKSFTGLIPTEEWRMWDEQGAQVAFNFGPKRAHSCTLWLGKNGTISGLMDMTQDMFAQMSKDQSYAEHLSKYYSHFPKSWHAPISQQMQAVEPWSEGASVRCSTLTGPNTVLVGDAGHAVRPAMGQGCNSALESAVVLSQVMKAANCSIPEAIRQYDALRKPDVHALYKLDLTAQPRAGTFGTPPWNLDYLGGKVNVLMGVALKKLFPQRFKGPAIMRMFVDDIPYSNARREIAL
ncbi:hypothetical protein WJX73_002117 [Symbiochloris irregularis]|uniref:FAD-binding domain-containing protein n=1 Tax=Symbiochloris irregularis TaxID=706552 RepID=A0AAW1P0E9_9CHLO